LSFAGIPALVAGGVIAYLVLAAGSTVVTGAPVVNFSSQATAATLPPPTRGAAFIGNGTCVKMAIGKHLPPLIHSDAAPDQTLLAELSVLRGSSTALDRTSLGSWDRYPLLIGTFFQRYARVFNGPGHTRVAFLPVTYCTQTEAARPSPKAPHGVVRETLRQGLVMLVLSNAGEHPPVLIGSARQIKQGPALAGLDVDTKQNVSHTWLQATVVPDGVSKVVMKFTPPFLHHYSHTVQIHSNVGIVISGPGYAPTTVLWYGANGKLIKKFVDRKEIAYDSCLAAHKKACNFAQSKQTRPPYVTAKNRKQTGSKALLAQANALYQPVSVFKRSVTAGETASARATNAHQTTEINACDARYGHKMLGAPAGTELGKVYRLWNDVTTLQTYEVDVAPVAPQLRTLVASWQALSLKNRAMNGFAHGMAAELEATLDAAPVDTCAFVRSVAAHHFSYKWALDSSYGAAAAKWASVTLKDSNRTSAFWRYINPPTLYAGTTNVYRAGGAGWRLFTHTQSSALANLPGEID
jgi:hypothetical protein